MAISSYKDIQGWFNYESLYQNVVNELPDNSIIVEIGAWKGASTAFLAECVKQSNKNIKLYVVDTWQGTPNEPIHMELVKEHDGNIFPVFKENLTDLGLFDLVCPLQLKSTEAAKQFKDETIDFVYIDAGHLYDDIKADIEAWLPKVKISGIIAGHDYPTFPDVVRAVNEKFGSENVESYDCSWIVRKAKLWASSYLSYIQALKNKQ